MRWFDLSQKEYTEYVKKHTPNSKLFPDMLKAFFVGGLICTLGQGFIELYSYLGLDDINASTYASVSLIFLGILFTGLGIYDNIANFAGAGTLVPITGFANAISSPALEFKSEGYVLGTGAKMFVICGPVLVYGISASILYGLIYYFTCI